MKLRQPDPRHAVGYETAPTALRPAAGETRRKPARGDGWRRAAQGPSIPTP